MKSRFLICFVVLVSAATPANAGDASLGKELFMRRCTGCHDTDKNKEGPHLRGVYGRVAGKAGGFSYSDGLKSAAFVWDEKSLNRWLTDPDSVVKDNDMAFRVTNSVEREHVIAYLKSLTN